MFSRVAVWKTRKSETMKNTCDFVGHFRVHMLCLLAAGLVQLAVGCAPVGQFRTLTIYCRDVINRGYPDDESLAEITHFVMSAEQTQEFFSGSAYCGTGWTMVWLRSYLGVVQLENGQKYRIAIDPWMSIWKPLGRPEIYNTPASLRDSDAWDARERLRQALAGRVFGPLGAFKRIQGLRGSAGKTRVVEIDGKYGYADRATKALVIPCRFSDALPFSEGLAAVRVDDAEGCKWGYIDEAGEFVIEPQFAGALPFSEGLAAVTVDDIIEGKQGYIDRSGKMVLAPQFEDAYPFYGGLATVFTEDKMRDIDRTGAVVKTYRGFTPTRYDRPPK